MLAEDGAEYPELRADAESSAEHILRLERLISSQADELAVAEAGWQELVALCDLAQWATETAGDGPAVVLVDDLRRLLARRRRTVSGG
ncbi:MAG: hypothetical protein ABIQ09_13480 [Jatrophihabitantaceae bacterium]